MGLHEFGCPPHGTAGHTKRYTVSQEGFFFSPPLTIISGAHPHTPHTPPHPHLTSPHLPHTFSSASLTMSYVHQPYGDAPPNAGFVPPQQPPAQQSGGGGGGGGAQFTAPPPAQPQQPPEQPSQWGPPQPQAHPPRAEGGNNRGAAAAAAAAQHGGKGGSGGQQFSSRQQQPTRPPPHYTPGHDSAALPPAGPTALPPAAPASQTNGASTTETPPVAVWYPQKPHGLNFFLLSPPFPIRVGVMTVYLLTSFPVNHSHAQHSGGFDTPRSVSALRPRGRFALSTSLFFVEACNATKRSRYDQTKRIYHSFSEIAYHFSDFSLTRPRCIFFIVRPRN